MIWMRRSSQMFWMLCCRLTLFVFIWKLQGFKTFNALYTLTCVFSSVCKALFFFLFDFVLFQCEQCWAIRFSSTKKWLKSSLYSWFLLMDIIYVFVATGTDKWQNVNNKSTIWSVVRKCSNFGNTLSKYPSFNFSSIYVY